MPHVFVGRAIGFFVFAAGVHDIVKIAEMHIGTGFLEAFHRGHGVILGRQQSSRGCPAPAAWSYSRRWSRRPHP